MKFACVGAGPAGLYLAILLKRHDANQDVAVLERNRAGVADGWGVVFWDDLVGDLRDNDPESASTILEHSFRWVDEVLDIAGAQPVRTPSSGFSIRRQRLLDILSKRALDLGVNVQFEREIADPTRLPDADVIIAADGVGSRLRQISPELFQTTLSTGRNKYVWLGTTRVFDAFTFGFVSTEAGWVWFHAYGCDADTSTFIVECSPETWTGLGLDSMGARDSLALLQGLFKSQLDGHRLVTRSVGEPDLTWLSFRTVTNQNWHADHLVLVGDAAHTTHFSIGSGTRLAIQDAIALAAQLRSQTNLAAALAAYQQERQRALAQPQREARHSAAWFENIERYIGLDARQFLSLMHSRRSSLMPYMPPLLYYGLKKGTAAPRKLLRQASPRAARRPFASSSRLPIMPVKGPDPVQALQQHVQPVQITLVENLDALWPRRSEWNALVEKSTTNTVFQTLEWQCSWWKAFGSNAQSLVLVAEVAGRMVAIAPLMLSRQRILGRQRRVVEFIGTHAADYCDFIVAAEQQTVVPLMLKWLIDRADQWDLLHLIDIAETSPLRDVLPPMFAQRGYTTHLHPLYECPTRIFGDRAADQRLLKKKDIREAYNQLRKQGQLEFRPYTAAAEIERYLDLFFQQHSDRWAETTTPSSFRDDRQRAFYRALIQLLAPNRWVLFSVVSFNQLPISFNFAYEYGNRLYGNKSTFNPDYRRFSPGMLQIRYLLQYGMERELKELDFTKGEEGYKYRFANHARLNYAARVYPPFLFYGIDKLVFYAKGPAKRSHTVSRLGRRLKLWLGDTFHRLGL